MSVVTRSSALPAPGLPSLQAAPVSYIVKAGDTLSGIARTQLGDVRRASEIQQLNRDVLPDPNKLRIGMALKLPADAKAAPPPAPPAPQPSSEAQGLFWKDNFKKHVALTFDDGPHPVVTPKVLDTLKQHHVKATFFVTGENAVRYPELVRRIVREGHTLGNHSYHHPDLAQLGPARIKDELDRTQSAVDKALGYHYELKQVRPPYGSTNGDVKTVLQAAGDQTVLWNVDSNDWRYSNNDQKIVDNVFRGDSSVYVRGGVILFHDVHPQGARVLDGVLKRLAKEGFTIETTDALLREKYPAPAKAKAHSAPRPIGMWSRLTTLLGR